MLHDFALGGTERIAVRLANRWATDGATVTIFCGSKAGPLRAMLDQSVKVVVADPPVARGPASRRVLAAALRRWGQAARFDVAFVPGNFHWPLIPELSRQGVPVVAQVSAALDKPQRGRLRQSLFDARMRRLLGRADAVVTLTGRARGQVERAIGRGTSHAIPLPALSDADAPPRPVAPDTPPVVLAAGRLVPEKGFATLIAAFARIAQRDAKLTIVGEGPERQALERQVRALGLSDRVDLPGYAPDVRPWLDAARLFVLSSQFEGYPAVLVEALAAGRRVVATDCTPATDLLRAPGAGAVVPIDDEAAMAAAIERLLGAPPPSPDALASLVAHHRIEQVAPAYRAVFEAVAR
ncbi:Glycosyltransferase involved in cell wall bisynthesis [Sphingomonas gellani]|uniref:Glycosyltransferase involved in cell wall bisynthesis n=1 Tax=Sphingomonas gellani TaxID=1166340 RepID=A0A1H8B133_9SPHN|nr:glycosyltransferase [Sphingomonas gellani]SEM76456.1 Glycosyltransferase involved in cell wall bisynthesis [Sphingomonas gellani]